MLKNYLKIAFRNLVRHKAYSALNIAGLAIGMASSILILLWVRNEWSFDRFHKNAGEIYRITASASEFKVAVSPAGMTPALKEEMPVVKNMTRVTDYRKVLFESTPERKFEEKKVFYVDSTFLDIFSFPLIKGDPATALMRKDAVLLTEDMAKKYFGTGEALGKTLKKYNSSFVTVTGILANIPANSHLQFDFIMPMSAIADEQDLKQNVWDNFNFFGYLQLQKNFVPTAASLAALGHEMDEIYKKHEKTVKVNFQLQPLTGIHLHSSYEADLTGQGNIQYVNIFFVVAIFILVVACINFMNLATARSAQRAKEVGLRKVIGALRAQLIGQFLGESMLVSFFALLFAIGLVFVFLPSFNRLADKHLAIHLLDGKFWLSLLGIALGTGLVAGSYPALFLSGFRPIKVLKGNLKSLGGNVLFRNTLVVTQFTVSIVLLVGTVVIYDQLTFIKNKNLGFDKANLLYMPMTGDIWNKQAALKAELTQNPLTANYTIINEMPTHVNNATIEVTWDGKDPNSQVVIPTMAAGDNFVDVFKMKILRGRGFSKDFNDTANYIVNEKALPIMGMTLDKAVGKSLTLHGKKGTIIGVLQDFNFKPIQQPIDPLIVELNVWGGNAVVRSSPGTTEATIKALGVISQKLNPSYPFSYNFLDQDLAALYKGEQQMGGIFNLFAILAILISCLGLYGLSAFMAQQRTKEIGVRKVLGASLFNIVYLLSTGFTRLVLIAVVIAVPLSWYAVHRWLQSFAYHVDIRWTVFVIAAVSAMMIAWLTVSYESIKAGITNPVKAIRSE